MHQIRRGRGAARLSPSQRSAELLCARIKGADRRFLREKLVSDHGLFSSYVGQQGAANGQDSGGVFQGCAGLWTAGHWLARRLYQLKAFTIMDLGISILLISAWRVALSVGDFCSREDVCMSLTRLLLIRLQRVKACRSSYCCCLYFFDPAPPNTCATYLGCLALSLKKCPLISFFHYH